MSFSNVWMLISLNKTICKHVYMVSNILKNSNSRDIQMKINLQIGVKFFHEKHFGLYMSGELLFTCLRTLVSIIEIVHYHWTLSTDFYMNLSHEVLRGMPAKNENMIIQTTINGFHPSHFQCWPSGRHIRNSQYITMQEKMSQHLIW